MIQIGALAVMLAVLVAWIIPIHPQSPSKVPRFVREGFPIVGALRFFTARWEFYREHMAKSPTGNFGFRVGKHAVVALSGTVGRQVFFQTPSLAIAEGYAVLLNTSPSSLDKSKKEESHESGFSGPFVKKLNHRLRRECLVSSLPALVDDVITRLDVLAESSSGITDPYDSFYEIVFQLTQRLVGSNEIARDPKLLKEIIQLYETVEKSTNPAMIILPWLPMPGSGKRKAAGTRLMKIFETIVEERRVTGRKEDDSVQYLLDMGEGVKDIHQFVMGSLFAGQLNAGITTASVLAYLATHPRWMDMARQCVESVLKKYAQDKAAPLWTQLHCIPFDAWESEFQVLEFCVRDTIRLQLVGALFRKNMSGHSIEVGDEIIPNNAFVAYHNSDIHLDANLYADPMKWDPSRYFSDREEDKRIPLAYIGWGTGRHPCPGMRFAKLQQNIILTAFLSRFEYKLVDDRGMPVKEVPKPNLNGYVAARPSVPLRLKYHIRN